MRLTYRPAVPDDAHLIADLVRVAYRGDESRTGWTTEADLLADERIDVPRVLAKIADPDGVVLLAYGADDSTDDSGADGALVACCEVLRRGPGLAYFGMFAVWPHLQAAGVGRQMLDEAERLARDDWGVDTMEMTVIGQRDELIAWYRRRGYDLTAERRPFPYHDLVNGAALRDDLYFAVLRKTLR